MVTRIKIATTAAELDAVFRLRHKVFVEEERYMQERPDRRIIDRFDAFPTTTNVIAVVDGRVVGSMRITEESDAGTSADTFFDFDRYVPSDTGRVGSASQTCIERAYRKTHGLTFALMGMAYHYAIMRGLTMLKTVINPLIEPLVRKTGWVAVAPKFFHEQYCLHCLPMILDLRKLNDTFLSFIKQQQIEHFLQSFDRQFHRAGDTIIRAGDQGDEAFIVVDGTVSVRRGDPDGVASVIVQELGPGELFGEIALLTMGRRTADVIAQSDVTLMVLEQRVFEDQVARNPAGALRLLRLVGSRAHGSLLSGVSLSTGL
jgi:N-acyl-L-homoserine lactone synthetase